MVENKKSCSQQSFDNTFTLIFSFLVSTKSRYFSKRILTPDEKTFLFESGSLCFAYIYFFLFFFFLFFVFTQCDSSPCFVFLPHIQNSRLEIKLLKQTFFCYFLIVNFLPSSLNPCPLKLKRKDITYV